MMGRENASSSSQRRKKKSCPPSGYQALGQFAREALLVDAARTWRSSLGCRSRLWWSMQGNPIQSTLFLVQPQSHKTMTLHGWVLCVAAAAPRSGSPSGDPLCMFVLCQADIRQAGVATPPITLCTQRRVINVEFTSAAKTSIAPCTACAQRGVSETLTRKQTPIQQAPPESGTSCQFIPILEKQTSA